MFYVDSHIHLQDYKTEDVKNVINAAQKNDVCRFVNVSAHPDDWEKIVSLMKITKDIIPAFGIHPWHINQAHPQWPEKMEELLQKIPSAWVGESGVDHLKNPDTDGQTSIFKRQIEMARKYGRPLIIHSVKADEIMRELFDLLPCRTIFHSFTGSVEWGKEIQRRGFYIGLNFSILRKKNFAQILQSLNWSQVLLETDGPYQSLEKNQETLPKDIPLLAKSIAEEIHIPLADLKEKLYQNWQNFTGEKHE